MAPVQCLQHGSGVNLEDLIKDSTAPMLKNLIADPSLRNSCTCNHIGDVAQCTPPTSGTPSYSTTRCLSLSQSLSTREQYDEPGTVTRPYSWASDHGGGQMFSLQLPEINVNAMSCPNAAELVNGGKPMHSGLALVHRHSDGAVAQTAYQIHAERITANH